MIVKRIFVAKLKGFEYHKIMKRKSPIDSDLIKNTLNSIKNKLKNACVEAHGKEAPSTCHNESVIAGKMGLNILETDQEKPLNLPIRIHPQLVILSFVLDGGIELNFDGMEGKVEVIQNESIFFSHPYSEIHAHLHIKAGSRIVTVITDIDKMHGFFDSNLDMNTISRDELKRYYDPHKLYLIKEINSKMSIPLRQILHLEMAGHFKNLYLEAKLLEILALYFNGAATGENTDLNCPFLDNPEDVKRIRKAKQLLLSNVSEPLTISQLSKKVGLNEFKLKNGFKDIYGAPIHTYLNEYRMQEAIRLLEECNYTVNEIAYMLGYNKPSNFIAAFKKKYGLTPKKYEMELVR